jgi:hypothetical protein
MVNRGLGSGLIPIIRQLVEMEPLKGKVGQVPVPFQPDVFPVRITIAIALRGRVRLGGERFVVRGESEPLAAITAPGARRHSR